MHFLKTEKDRSIAVSGLLSKVYTGTLDISSRALFFISWCDVWFLHSRCHFIFQMVNMEKFQMFAMSNTIEDSQTQEYV